MKDIGARSLFNAEVFLWGLELIPTPDAPLNILSALSDELGSAVILPNIM